MCFTCCSGISIVDIEQVHIVWERHQSLLYLLKLLIEHQFLTIKVQTFKKFRVWIKRGFQRGIGITISGDRKFY